MTSKLRGGVPGRGGGCSCAACTVDGSARERVTHPNQLSSPITHGAHWRRARKARKARTARKAREAREARQRGSDSRVHGTRPARTSAPLLSAAILLHLLSACRAGSIDDTRLSSLDSPCQRFPPGSASGGLGARGRARRDKTGTRQVGSVLSPAEGQR